MTRSLARNDRKRDVGTPSPTTAHRTRPQGAMPTHRPAGQMRILRRDTWVPPYRVRRSCRTGRRDAVPYNGSPHPSAGDDAHASPRRSNAHFAAGHMDPALQGTPVMQDGTSRTPSPTTAHRTHPQGMMPTAPHRTNAHSAAGHMGPALQGTPVMQDGTSGRRPLQRFTVPVRRGTMPTSPRRTT